MIQDKNNKLKKPSFIAKFIQFLQFNLHILFVFIRSYLLPGSGTKDVKLLSTKSNVQYSGQWMFKIGWPKMGSLNMEAADSFVLKDNERPLYFIVDQCEF